MALSSYHLPHIRQSETLQLVLLDTLYGLSASKDIIFQGGTALRWVYGGMRFSEDLDFVTPLSGKEIEHCLNVMKGKVRNVCTAQFGNGDLELRPQQHRSSASKVLCIYRPRDQRERIAVKLEFEKLSGGMVPRHTRKVLRDLPMVTALLTGGKLFLHYSSSILLVETPEEMLTDKLRALFERPYIKGRDVYDIWWLCKQMHVPVDWQLFSGKTRMYQAPFKSRRSPDFFLNSENEPVVLNALVSDLARFIPPAVFDVYEAENFKPFWDALQHICMDVPAGIRESVFTG